MPKQKRNWTAGEPVVVPVIFRDYARGEVVTRYLAGSIEELRARGVIVRLGRRYGLYSRTQLYVPAEWPVDNVSLDDCTIENEIFDND